MRSLRIRPLTEERLRQAFPLVQTWDASLTLEDWEAFARPLLEDKGAKEGKSGLPERGIMTVENEQGYISGFFSYHCVKDLRHGRLLFAENLVAFDFIDRDTCYEALCAALENLAHRLGCGAIHTIVADATSKGEAQGKLPEHGKEPRLRRLLEARGHHEEGWLLCKRLTGRNPCGPI